jgi:hypothetical protein
MRLDVCRSSLLRNRGGAPFKSASATSIPSADVPLIIPITSMLFSSLAPF